MREDFLQYLWRLKKFDQKDMKTTAGDPIVLHRTGQLNTGSGPDFINAKMQIGDTLWAGNVEIHVRSSDWIKHGHQDDKAYKTVILHVVNEEDQPIFYQTGERIPCLVLKNRIPPKIFKTYRKLLHSEQWIACQHHFFSVSGFTKKMWLERLTIERLEQKIRPISETLNARKNNWEETFYLYMARNFGVKINADAFEKLADSVPLLTLTKHKNNLFQLEALLFGQAGLLEGNFEDDYPKELKKEYNFLRKKYGLTPIDYPWKFMRLRPANFPTIRIAQFANLIHRSVHLFSKILETKTMTALRLLFELELSDYWNDHYVFDKISDKKQRKLGKNTVDLIIINTIIPFLFFYGKHKGIEELKERAVAFLRAVKPESNSIITEWKKLGEKPGSAAETQALLQLRNEYCRRKRCLDCAIGNVILSD